MLAASALAREVEGTDPRSIEPVPLAIYPPLTSTG